MKLAEAFVEILADDKTDGVFRSVEGKTKGFVGNLSSSILSLGTGAVLAGATAAVGAVTAIGVAAFNSASDVQGATNMLQTQLGISEEKARSLGEVIKNVYGNNFGGSIAEVGEAIGIAGQQFTNFGQMANGEIQAATEAAFGLQDAFGADLGSSMNAANALMTNFGLSSQQAFDFITAGYQRGLDSSGDFLDSIGEYATQFGNAGADAGQFFSVMETGLGAGMLGTDKAADMFKEFTVRIQDGSNTTSDALAAIGLDAEAMAAGFQDGSLTAAQAFDMVQTALRETDDQNVQFQAGVALLGTQFEDLGTSAALGVDMAATSLASLEGSTESLNAQYDSLGSMMEGMWRQVQTALEPIGAVLLDLATRAMPLVQAGFEWFQTTLVPMIETAAEVLGEFIDNFIGGLESGLSPIEAFKDALREFIPQEAMQVLEFFIDTITNVLQNSLDTARGIVEAFGMALEGDFAGAFERVGQIVQERIILIVETFGNLWNLVQPKLAEWWSALVAWAGSQDWQQIGLDIITFIIEGLKEFVALVGPVLADWWNAFWEWFGNIDWAELGYTVVKSLIEGLKFFVTEVIPTLASWVSAFFQYLSQVDWLSLGKAIIDGIIQGITTAGTALFDALKGIAEGAVRAVKESLGIQSPSKVFMNVGRAIPEGLAQGIKDGTTEPIQAAMEMAAKVIQAVAGAIGTAVAALNAINNSSIGASVIDNINLFQDQVQWIVQAFARVYWILTASNVKVAEKMATAADKVAKTIINTIAALGALNRATLPVDIDLKIEQFAKQVLQLTEAFANVAQEIEQELLEAVADFADAAMAAIDLVEPGLAAATALANFDFAAVTQEGKLARQIWWFRNIIRTLVNEFQEAAILMSADLAGAVKDFADAATSIVGLVADGLSAAADLANFDFGAVTQQGKLAGQIVIFRNIIRTLVREFAAAADAINFELFGAVVEFADGARAVIDIIADGLEAVTTLANFDFGKVTQGGKLVGQITALVAFIKQLVQGFAQAAAEIRGELLAKAVALSEAAGSIIDIIKPGIEAFMALGEYISAENLEAAAEQFTNDLMNVVVQLVSGLNIVVMLIGQQVLTAAAEVANALQDIIGIIDPGIEALKALAAYVSAANLDQVTEQFINDLANVAVQLVSGLNLVFMLIGQQALDLAQRVAESIRSLVATIDEAVGLLNRIAESEQPDVNEVLSWLIETVQYIAQVLTSAQATISGSLVAAAQNFAKNVRLMVDAVLQAITELARLLTANVPGTLQGILNEMVAAMGTKAAEGMSRMLAAFRSGGQALVAEARRIAQAIVGAFDMNWTTVGSNISKGIANGISAGSSAIAAAARKAAEAAMNAVKGDLGIHSPAKVPEQEIGVPIAQGIAKGIMDNVGTVQMALGDLLNFGTPQMALAGAAASPQMIEIHVSGRIENETITARRMADGSFLATSRARGLR